MTAPSRTFLCCIVRIGADPGLDVRCGGVRTSGPMKEIVAEGRGGVKGEGFWVIFFGGVDGMRGSEDLGIGIAAAT